MERKLLNAFCGIVSLGITAFGSPLSHASEVPIERIKLLVADAFRYPVEKLKITPNDAPSGRSSFGVESDDGTFFPVTLDMGERGSVLKPQFEAQLTAMLAKVAEQKGSKSGLRKVQLSNQGYAYLGIGAGGPGGAQSGAIFVFPKSGTEVAITVTASREANINIEAAPKEYQVLMSENSPDMADRITRLAEQIVAICNVSGGSQHTGNTSSAQQPPAPSVPIPAPSVAVAGKTTPTLESPSIVQDEPSKSLSWPWIIGAILLVAVAVGILLKFRRK